MKRTVLGNGQHSRSKYLAKLWDLWTTLFSLFGERVIFCIATEIDPNTIKIKECTAFGSSKVLHLG